MSSLLAGFALGLAHFNALEWSVRRVRVGPRAFLGGSLLRMGFTLVALACLTRLGGSPALALAGLWVARQTVLWRGAPWS